MKKKRSIQKLKFHKEKISTLNEVTGGAKVTTTIVYGTAVAVSIAVGYTCQDTCTIPRESGHWMICAADETEGC